MTPEKKRVELQEQANELLIETTSEMTNEEIQTLIDDELGTDPSERAAADAKEAEEAAKAEAAAKPKASKKAAPANTKAAKKTAKPEVEADGDEETLEVEMLRGYVPQDKGMLEELGFRWKLPVGYVCELPMKEAKKCVKAGIATFPDDEDEDDIEDDLD